MARTGVMGDPGVGSWGQGQEDKWGKQTHQQRCMGRVGEGQDSGPFLVEAQKSGTWPSGGRMACWRRGLNAGTPILSDQSTENQSLWSWALTTGQRHKRGGLELMESWLV